jgi:predicted metal-dependent phosphotriesterase family hydrolase
MRKLIILIFLHCACLVYGQDGVIYTVKGKISSKDLNTALTHEHVMSNFGGDAAAIAVYDSVALFKQVIPYLQKIKALGVQAIFDCTAAYFGRNVSLLKRLADSTGLHIITNTGFYGAANDKYIPAFAFTATAKQIANTWIDEFENGIDNTGIKPGFIKLAFDDGAPSAIDCKLFEAGIVTHLKTGLTIQVHTGNNVLAANEQLRLLNNKKVSAAAWVWAHANKADDVNVLIDAALKGAWISLDGITASNTGEYIKKLQTFKDKKLLHKVLLSHDGNSFPRGGAIRKYEDLLTKLVPELLKNGFLQEEIDQLIIHNPKAAFEIRVRKNK